MKKLIGVVGVVLALGCVPQGEVAPVSARPTDAAVELAGPTNNPEDQWRHCTMYGTTTEHVRDFAEAGFNALRRGQTGTWSFKKGERIPDKDEFVRTNVLNACRAMDGLEMGYCPIFSYSGNAEAARLYPRTYADGSKGVFKDKKKPMKVDAANPDYLRGLAEAIRSELRWLKDMPNIGFFQPGSEMRDHIGPSFTPAMSNAYRRATGREVPPEAVGRNPIPWQKLKDFPADRIVPDDWPVLEFYRWHWTKGDGWNEALGTIVDVLREKFGHGYPMMFNPATRQPPIFGCINPKLTMLATWAYPTPEPAQLIYPMSQLQAVGRQYPKAQIGMGWQAIVYRRDTAPVGVRPKGGVEPDWIRRFPNVRYPTTPADLCQESMWICFSRRLDAISTHHESSLFDVEKNRDLDYYQCTDPTAIRRISKVNAEVGVPLGPLFRAVPERMPEVAVLESASAQILGGHITWAPNEYFNNQMLVIAVANVDHYVIYEDEIRTTGIPKEIKVIVLPKCDVLTRTTYDRLVEFQRRGGRLIGDSMLLKALKADATFPSITEEGKSTVGDFDDGNAGHFMDSEKRQTVVRSAAAKLKKAIGLVQYADADRDSILVHARTYGRADYVFAINDNRTAGDYMGQYRRILEKGLPSHGTVRVQRAAGAVYDLVRHCQVPFRVKDGVTEIPVAYETNDGRVFMVVDSPLRPLSFKVVGSKLTVSSPDRDAIIPIRIEGAHAKPWYAVVRDGVWSRDFGKELKDVRVTNLADGSEGEN